MLIVYLNRDFVLILVASRGGVSKQSSLFPIVHLEQSYS